MLTVLHGSDLQAGRPYRPEAAAAFLRLARELAPGTVVISGDLTQRAKVAEYRVASALIAQLSDVPVIVVPGNHDVPLFRLWERALDPYRNWRTFIAPELDTVTRVPGATFVALNSSAPWRAIVNGRIDPPQVEFARTAFERAPHGDARVLVVHHHFRPVPKNLGGRPLPGGEDLLRAFEGMRVDVLFGGHMHQTRVMSSRPSGSAEPDRPGIAMVTCGTTTSTRGRGVEEGRHSLTVVRIGDDAIEVIPYLFDEVTTRFAESERLAFPRQLGAASRVEEGGRA